MEPVLWQIKSVKQQENLGKQMSIKVTSLRFMDKGQAGCSWETKIIVVCQKSLKMLAQDKFATDYIRDGKLVLCYV